MTQSNRTPSASDRLVSRVEDARARASAKAERAAATASDAASDALKLIKDHPIAALGGALVIGALASQLLPGTAGRLSRKRSRRVLELAAGAAELAIAYGKHASDAASESGREGVSRIGLAGEDFGAKVSTKLSDLAESLSNRLGDSTEVARKRGRALSGSAADLTREAGTLAARKLREIADRLES